MRRCFLYFLVASVLLLQGCQVTALPATETTPDKPIEIRASVTPALPHQTPTRTAPPPTPSATLNPSPTSSETIVSRTLEANPTCTLTAGTVITGSLESELLYGPLDFRIYRPPCYEHDPGRRYPVLYLLHGLAYSDDQWDRLGADETADRLISGGEIAPFLIVMPRDRFWGDPPYDPFGSALVEELIPWIDAHYRTLPERQYRAIGGLSRGASWSVHLGLTQWELFGSIGGHSLPVFVGDVENVEHWLDAIPRDRLPRLYLDLGDRDGTVVVSAKWFVSVLTEKGIPHEWHLFPGHHEEAYWQSHVEQYLRFYAKDW